MILIITNKTDYTADYVILALKRRGIEFARFNTEDYPTRTDLAIEINANSIDGFISLQGRIIQFHQIFCYYFSS